MQRKEAGVAQGEAGSTSTQSSDPVARSEKSASRSTTTASRAVQKSTQNQSKSEDSQGTDNGTSEHAKATSGRKVQVAASRHGGGDTPTRHQSQSHTPNQTRDQAVQQRAEGNAGGVFKNVEEGEDGGGRREIASSYGVEEKPRLVPSLVASLALIGIPCVWHPVVLCLALQ